ncbi:HsdR family type I site-specific deoxyribonuclease [Patescibacteria group bacterium]|nr:HsdR family type I site-specific deoxyribonuclease [Patescibacteria group bacterium]MBU1124265.1 HsdR family type I site-specific deoxyribonuclease [Patescibacteria group bacterium]
MDHLANEAGTVQFTLVKHAASIGWDTISDSEAISKRQGESGIFFYKELEESLLRLNPEVVTPENVQSIIQRMEASPATIAGNREILEWLRGKRSIYSEEEQRQRNIALIDYEDLSRNVFQVTYEWKYKDGNEKGNRADVIFLINGVPVAIVENKNPKLPDAMERAVKQLRRYERETPELLLSPQVFNVTHLIEYFYGVTWNYSRKDIVPWKEKKSDTYKDAVQSFFDKERFLTMLKEWILFFIKDDELRKAVLRQHQTRAVQKVMGRCREEKRKTGLVWHTQGSGKTFTLITAARMILEDKKQFPGATVMLMIDRNELQTQLSGWVETLVGEMQGLDVKIEYATRKRKLQELLDQDFRGLIISMIHKFDGIRKDSCTREDFFVLIDEAHRSTGGDLGNYLMGALPNATLIGFTGTPIDKTSYGKGTFKIFGKEDDKGYLDKYSIRESIEDGTTVVLRHQLSPNTHRLPEELLDAEFLNIAESEGISDVEDLNKILDRAVRTKAFLKSDDHIEKVAQFIANHFKENVQPLGYKAFLVAIDREACALYKEALDKYLPPEYTVPIYTENVNDAEERPLAAKHQIGEEDEKNVRKLFPKPSENPKIFIVTDKLLTGYDAPVLYCMYLDKPMRDHVLLQAVARVNRPYEDGEGIKKPCGLIIDFVGVLKDLNKALAFDAEDVSGIIENLDVLMARFKELIGSKGKEYLESSGGGTNDEKLEKLLYDVFLDKEKRQAFVDFFKELESLYEILSPSAELRDYVEEYNLLADLYVMLRNAYGVKTNFFEGIAHKTEELVRKNATVHGLDKLTKAVEFDVETLASLKKKKGSETAKVINLIRSLQQTAEEHGDEEPYLIPIAIRATRILENLEDRQISTQEAMKKIEALMHERIDAEKERGKTGLGTNAFTIYWVLKQEGIRDSIGLAKELENAYQRFPNYRSNSDELRQLKAEMYKTLLKAIDGRRMVDIADQILSIERV